MAKVRNAQQEGRDRVGAEYDVRVLEPSPPTVTSGPYLADDPTAAGDREPGRVLVSPTPGGDALWDDILDGDTALREWVADHWLGAYKRLEALPDAFAETREALHVLAAYVVSPAREAANGKIGLRYTYRGFGTPFFGDDEQVRVEAGELVYQRASAVEHEPITTLNAALHLVGVTPPLDKHQEFDVPAPGDPEATLAVDPRASALLGDWFGLGTSVLEHLRADAAPEDEADRVQIWPEHFDIALVHGRPGPDEDDYGARANYGFSPGDSAIPEPYAYVGPWKPREGEFWNAEPFPGAVLTYAELADVPDPHRTALEFFREGAKILRSGVDVGE